MAQEFTLQQLLGGEATASVRVRIKGLLHIPPLAIAGVGGVELLDVSDGSLQDLPSNFSELHCLKTLFASNNNFARAPCLDSLASLDMVAFRCNRMIELSSAALPQMLRWLILTDNLIDLLPEEIGACAPARHPRPHTVSQSKDEKP